MSLSSHLEELRKKHQTLSDRVDDAQQSPGSSDLEITELKKQKLRLKEEIHRLSAAS
ncbi:MAG: YdcH family protein [Pseudomonadota bacterium]